MSTTPTTASIPSPHNAAWRGLPLVCIATGFSAALFYIAWHVRFSAVFGASALVDTTAVCGALAGLVIGAAIVRRLPRQRPYLVIAGSQAAFAVTALALPWVLTGLTTIDRVLLGSSAETPEIYWLQILVQSSIGVLCYAVPCVLVAVTLIVAIATEARAPHESDHAVAGRTFGLAGLGAAVGVVVGTFAIAPIAGLAGSGWLAIAISATTAAALARMARRAMPLEPAAMPEPDLERRATPTTVTASGKLMVSRLARRHGAGRTTAPGSIGRLGRSCLLGATFLAGAGALAGQYLWFRVIAHADATDTRVSLVMLASALAGFGVGALVGRWLVTTRLRPGASIAAVGLVAAAATVLLYVQALSWLMPLMPAASLAFVWPAIHALPLAVLGIIFSIVTEIGSADTHDAPRVGSSALTLIALGGAAGGVIVWLWVLPSGGFEVLVEAVAITNVAVALLAIPLIDGRGRLVAASAACLAIALAVIGTPGRPEITAIAIDDDVIAVARPLERFYAAGRTHAVRVLEHQGRFLLQVDGARRAWVAVSGSAPTQDAHKWLATLPVTARPDARSMLALGLAGGVMLEGIPRSIAHVDVIEPESAIAAANRAIAADRLVDPLEQPKIRIVANDPRRALRLSAERYDIIVSQLSPSRSSQRVPTFSRELLAELRVHLVDGGVIAQLIDGITVSSPIVQSVAATLRAEFAHVRLYRPEPGSLIFLASTAPIEPELQLARSGAPLTSEIMHYSTMGMNGVEDLLATLVADEAGVEALAGSGAIRSDNTLAIDARDAPSMAEAVDAAIVAADPLRQRSSWVYADVADAANFAYLTRRLIAQGQQERALAASEAHPDESMRLTMVGLLHASRGQADQAIAAYRAALEQRADNAEARYLLIQPNMPLFMQEVIPPGLERLTEGLPGSAAAMIVARRAGAAQDWAAIANLDGVLSAASVTDAWYPDVVLVRAEWRSRAEQNVEQLAFDALRLIDRVVLIDPNRNFFLLRAASGIALGDGDIAVESSRGIVRLIAQLIQSAADGEGRIERRQVELIRQNLDAIRTNLSGELVADNARRAEEVRQGASLLLRFLDASLVDEPQ